jgi:hypothetical protein
MEFLRRKDQFAVSTDHRQRDWMGLTVPIRPGRGDVNVVWRG